MANNYEFSETAEDMHGQENAFIGELAREMGIDEQELADMGCEFLG